MDFIKNSLCLLDRYAKLNVHVGNDSASLPFLSNRLLAHHLAHRQRPPIRIPPREQRARIASYSGVRSN